MTGKVSGTILGQKSRLAKPEMWINIWKDLVMLARLERATCCLEGLSQQNQPISQDSKTTLNLGFHEGMSAMLVSSSYQLNSSSMPVTWDNPGTIAPCHVSGSRGLVHEHHCLNSKTEHLRFKTLFQRGRAHV